MSTNNMGNVVLVTGQVRASARRPRACLAEGGRSGRVDVMEPLRAEGIHPLALDVTDEASIGLPYRQSKQKPQA